MSNTIAPQQARDALISMHNDGDYQHQYERVRDYIDQQQARDAALSDEINGTPCAELRWAAEREKLQAEIDRLRDAVADYMTPAYEEATRAEAALQAAEPVGDTLPDDCQDWRGVDGAIAWHLIDRHADDWAETGQMMNAWLAANAHPPQVRCADCHEPTGGPSPVCDGCAQLRCESVAAASSAPVGVAEAWQEGYRQGVLDERTSEANIGIAGFGAKVEPARNNPYLAQQPAAVDEECAHCVDGIVPMTFDRLCAHCHGTGIAAQPGEE